jgi:hypothetical protein
VPASTVTGVSVSPAAHNMNGGTTQQFTATVSGTNSPSQGVTWSASAGAISSSGLFTAPAATSSAQTVTITATSTQDGSRSGTATVTVAEQGKVYTARTTVSPGGAAIANTVFSSTPGTWAGSTGDKYASMSALRLKITDQNGNAPENVKFAWGKSATQAPAGMTYASAGLAIGAADNDEYHANGFIWCSKYGSWTSGQTSNQYYGIFTPSQSLFAWQAGARATSHERFLWCFPDVGDPFPYTNGTGAAIGWPVNV